MWDEFCIVCGSPPYVFFDGLEDEEGQSLLNPADYAWLGSFVGVSNKEELIPLTYYDGYGNFDIEPDTSPYSCFGVGCLHLDYVIDEKTVRGFACHVTCYNLLQQELNYTLKYTDVEPLSIDNNYCHENSFSWSDYGGLAEQGCYLASLGA